jgi:pyruvate dehydrogenase E2 component (dihydrolipoamide acetyltransferase)
MPKLSDAMEEATVLQWLKHPGDRVARGEPLVEVETDKATIVYEAERVGTLAEIVVAEGETAPLGGVIARIAVEGEAPAPAQAVQADAPLPAAAAEPEPAETPEPPAALEASPGAPAAGERARATPVARRLAAELGVELAKLRGSGPGGRIVRADVRAAAGDGRTPAAAPAGGRGEVVDVPLTTTQRTIAKRMSESRSEIPDFTLVAELDMEAANALREELRDIGREPLPSFNDLLVKAVGLALRDFPALNGSFQEGRILHFGRINVGIAVATDDGLFVPTVFDADSRSVFEIAAESARLIEKVRGRSIAPDDLADGTFTVSNLGMFGVRRFEAVINAPQAAILAVGEVTRRPWADPDGNLVARRLVEVSLSCDHRIVYGAEAARFLQRLRHLVEHPVHLVVPA